MPKTWMRLLLCIYAIALASHSALAPRSKILRRKTFRHSNGSIVESSVDVEARRRRRFLKNLEEHLTTDAYINLADENSTKEYQPMEKVKEQVFSNLRRSWQQDAINRPPEIAADTPHLVVLVCAMLQSTYRAGLKDLHKFYVARLPFLRTEAFETGYLAQEIVYRYQIMVELYQLARRKYVKQDMHSKDQPFGNTMPAQYMFYIYLNLIEQAKAVTHLCYMQREIGPKYKARRERLMNAKSGPKHSIWSDFSDADEKYPEPAPTTPPFDSLNLTSMREYLERLRKKRLKLLHQNRDSFKFFERRYNRSTLIGPHNRKPKSYWPLDYGWSVEMLDF